MPHNLDLDNWARRQLFDFFQRYDQPYFNVCTQLDITKLMELLESRPNKNVAMTYLYFALRVANEIEPFRYRLKGDQILVHDIIHGGSTVLMPDETFSFAYFDYSDNFEEFIEGARSAIDEVRSGDGVLRPTPRDNLIYFTILPWFSFTSFAHARNSERGLSVPRIAFGKFLKAGGRVQLPISVEVHHALMDGLHVGKYLNRLQEALDEPSEFIVRSN
jgi:chloramphenicol O-acetyltransferase type A